MEFLDIRDKNGNPTGEVKERSLVHADGDIHGTSHVWIVRKNEKGSYDLLLQKRSENKDAFPGCYDISSAGHLPAGQDYLSSALRELEEELGIKEPVNIEDLTLQKEEVQEVCWLDFKECCKKVKDGDKKYCLFPEELLMIKKYLQFYLK